VYLFQQSLKYLKQAATKLRKGIRMQLKEMLADSTVKEKRINEENRWKYYKVLSCELLQSEKFKTEC
jgi:hypothetical protein